MIGRIAALYRHPVKGFTPEPINAVVLTAGGHFPCDRIYTVEDGPSGFDPNVSAHISKMRFAVLAKIPALARARTAYDEASGEITVQSDGGAPFVACLTTPEGRGVFAAWLERFLAHEEPEDRHGPLKVLAAPQGRRFMDSPQGFVSVLNLASVRDLEQRLGRPVDPRRFRANILVEGWPAWFEYGHEGRALRLGEAELAVLNDTVRCVATHADPVSGDRDIDIVPELFARYGHRCCGVYAGVIRGGRLAVGDVATASELDS
jgi:uncharacterized protein YcbX